LTRPLMGDPNVFPRPLMGDSYVFPTERAGVVTLHPMEGAPQLYPDPLFTNLIYYFFIVLTSYNRHFKIKKSGYTVYSS